MENTMRIFICDDDPVIQNQLHTLLTKYFKKKSYPQPEFFIYNSGDELLKSSVTPDIVFLDIEMEGLDGIYVGNELHKKYKYVITIIVTAFSEYLDDAMRFNVFRYLSKPINSHRLYKNLDDALIQYNLKSSHIIINDNKHSYKVSTDDIIMIETSPKERVNIVHTLQKDYHSVDNMQYWNEILCKKGSFYQCNRSYIINLKYISSYTNELIKLHNNQYTAYITKRKVREFRSLYLMYLEHVE